MMKLKIKLFINIDYLFIHHFTIENAIKLRAINLQLETTHKLTNRKYTDLIAFNFKYYA